MTRATELRTPEPSTLLLVHGDILVRTALAAYLRECGYDVVEAGTTEEAAGVPRAAAEAGELCEQGPTQRKPYDHQTLERHIRRLLAR